MNKFQIGDYFIVPNTNEWSSIFYGCLAKIISPATGIHFGGNRYWVKMYDKPCKHSDNGCWHCDVKELNNVTILKSKLIQICFEENE